MAGGGGGDSGGVGIFKFQRKTNLGTIDLEEAEGYLRILRFNSVQGQKNNDQSTNSQPLTKGFQWTKHCTGSVMWIIS